VPTLSPPRPAQRGVGRRPTLVDNVETLAHVGLIARFGARWWRRAGADGTAGTTLLTVTGAVQRPGVREVPVGAPLAGVLDDAVAGHTAGILVGGYFGTWLTVEQARTARLDHDSLRAIGAGLGCGAIVVLPDEVCPLAELSRVTWWLAAQSAGQCGPCVNGLPSIAAAVEDVASRGSAEAVEGARRWADMVRGRGACRLPDGAISFVTSGLDVFAQHVELHRWRGPCAHTEPVLPVPAVRGTPLTLRGPR
jgi:NADH:ubiquinone oxidoreductase subunit F (NADH-binding)